MTANTAIKGIGGENDRCFTVPIEGQIIGTAPAVILLNPRYGHNVGNAMRACSVFGVSQLWWTGERVELDLADRKLKNGRLPREERMKGWKSVQLFNHDRPLEFFENVVPVCLEITPGAEDLATFEHPENAVYVFGPEDGQVDHTIRRHCHRFVTIPTEVDDSGKPLCLNLAAACNVVLYDRRMKSILNRK